MAEVKEMSVATKAALDVLSGADRPLSLSEISEMAGIEVKPGNISALIKKGAIVSEEREDVCPTCGHKHAYKVFSIKR